jgi:hypothetical protein
MAKEPRDFTADDIAREMEKRADSLDHLRARAELERRRTRYMLISAIGTSVSAMGAAIAAIVAAIVAARGGRLPHLALGKPGARTATAFATQLPGTEQDKAVSTLGRRGI